MKSTILIVLGLSLVLQLAMADNMEQFRAFMDKHNKKYATQEEFNTRYAIFNSNLKKIAQLNSMKTSATFGVNKFADLTTEEFKKYYLSTTPQTVDPSWPVLPTVSQKEIQDLPDSVDWRTKGVVTAVKNQGQCGSCWSFSTTGNVEGQWALAGNKLVGLSEQNLVDCDTTDSGCNGGLMSNAFEFIIKNGGIDTESSYPYEAVDDTCRFNPANVGAKISNWTMIPSDEDQMAAYLVKQGPVAIAVDAQLWQYYIEGIFDFYFCGSTLDHGVLIVGYGHGENILFEDTKYWIIKNSWGADWGESGYIRLERGENLCAVNAFPCTSFV